MTFRKADYVWLIDADVVYASRSVNPEDSIGMCPTWEIPSDDLLDILERLGLRIDWPETKLGNTGAVRVWRSAALSGTVTWHQVWAHVRKNGLSLRLESRADNGSIESAEQAYNGRYQIQWAGED